MAITRTQNVSATANNVAITSTTNGDLIVVWAYFAGTATIPSLPGGFTNITSSAGTQQACRLGYKISTGGDTTSGTWTNATQVVCHVYRGASAIGAVSAVSAGNTTTLLYPIVALQNATGSSWVAAFGGASSATAGMNGTPTGTAPNLGNRTSQVKANGLDTGAGVTSFTNLQSLVVTTSGRWQTVTLEIKSPSVFTQSYTPTCSPTAAFNKRINDGGFVANLSFTGAFTRARLFLESFTATLFGGWNFATGLVSYWKLDEASGTRFDSFGTNHLTDNNTVVSFTGIQGNAADFTSANSEYLSCASNSSLQMSGNTDFTIACWVLFKNTGDFSIVTKDSNAANSRDFTLDGNWSFSQWRFYIKGGATYIALAPISGGWHFLVAWYDSSNGQCHIRVDDTYQGNSATGATGTDVSSAEFRIGARQYVGFEDYSNAYIDEVAIWKRLLTPAEITALYNSGAGTTYGSGIATLTRLPRKSLTATLSDTAALIRKITDAGFTATLSFVGAVIKSSTRKLTAAISFIGNVASNFIHGGTLFTQSFTATLFGGSGTGIGTQTNTDDFNRANQNPIAGNWTTPAGAAMKIISNTVSIDVLGTDSYAFWNIWSGGNDQYSQVDLTVTGTGAGSGPGVAVRKASGATDTYYRLVMDAAGAFELGKIVTSSFTSLRTGSVSYVAGQKLGLSASGSSTTTLKIWYNGVQIGTNFTDSSSPITTGSPGLAYSSVSSAVTLDNWDAGTVGGGGPFASLSRKTGKALSATWSPVAALARKLGKGLSATLSFVGAITRRSTRFLAATLSFTGLQTASKSFLKAFTATLSFIGNLATNWIHGGTLFTQSLAATLTPTALLTKRILDSGFAATLSFTGAITRKLSKAFTATLSFIGATTKRITDAGFTATLSFTGFQTASKSFLKAFSATLSFVGNLGSNLIHGGTLFFQSFTATLFQGGGGSSAVIDSYSESNQDSVAQLSAGVFTTRWAQCFTGNGSKIVDAKWYVQKHSGPTGNAFAKIYAMTGTFGTSGIPTGSALATSDAFDVSTITTITLITFTFSGANQYVTTNGTNYVVSIEFTGGDSGNYLEVGYDGSSATHTGNIASWDGAIWTPISSALDFCFYVDGLAAGGPSATLTRKLNKALSATLSFVGAIRRSVRKILSGTLWSSTGAVFSGATWNSDGSPSSIQSLHDSSASNGDIITLPPGTFSWPTGVALTKTITLKGAGTSATGGGDQTIITDNYASGSPLLSFQMGSTAVSRMTGITVQSGSGSIKDGGTVAVGGAGKIRIDHCHFISTSAANYKTVQVGCFGLMDHCILDLTSTNAIFLYNGRSGGGGDIQGNLEWTLPTNFGSNEYFYIEDNIINGSAGGTTYDTRIFDGFTAAKAVVRFNTVSQAVLGETHATGHAPDDRGLRSQEIYGNAVTSSLAHDPNFCAVDMGNGTTLLWGNSWDQVYKSIYLLKQTRKDNTTYGQTATPGGWGYAGTEFNGTGSNWDGGAALGTDTLKGYPVLDQVGRGSGDLLTGVFPTKVNNTTGTIFWPHQSLEPVYIWNNTGTFVSGWGGATYNDDTGGRVVSDRDYYRPASGIQVSPTSPFNGTTGCGWGTLANRPTTCTTGVGYFAIDQGSWNKSASNPYGVQQSGTSGVLYVATATNTWTLYYTPYTYPHPLTAVGGWAQLVKRIIDSGFSATLSFIGNLATSLIHGGTAFTKSLSASLSFIGSMSARQIATRAFTATLNATATLSRSTRKAFNATLSAAASLIRRITRTFSGTFLSTGTLVKAIRDAGFTATLSFVGNLVGIAAHFFTRAFTATLAFSATLTRSRIVQRVLTATLAFSGAFSRRIGKVFAATLSFSTTTRKMVAKVLRGTLALLGFLFKGGAVTVLAGWITQCFATIGIGGSTAKVVHAGSQLTVQKFDEQGVQVQATGSTLRVERTK